MGRTMGRELLKAEGVWQKPIDPNPLWCESHDSKRVEKVRQKLAAVMVEAGLECRLAGSTLLSPPTSPGIKLLQEA